MRTRLGFRVLIIAGAFLAARDDVDAIRGPGHNSILVDDDEHYIVHHYVNIAEGPASPDSPLAIPRSLQIRPLYWGWDGWPVAGKPVSEPS